MRWSQRTYKRQDGVTVMTTKESVAPFRSFEQNGIRGDVNNLGSDEWVNEKLIRKGFWLLPDNVDELIENMDKAREEKNWSLSDEIRKELDSIGIIVRNGIDWYPKLLENDLNADRLFNAWLYSTWMSDLSSYEGKDKPGRIKEIKEHAETLKEELKEKYNM